MEPPGSYNSKLGHTSEFCTDSKSKCLGMELYGTLALGIEQRGLVPTRIYRITRVARAALGRKLRL